MASEDLDEYPLFREGLNDLIIVDGTKDEKTKEIEVLRLALGLLCDR